MKLSRRQLKRLIKEALEPSVQEKIADMTQDEIETAIDEIENYSKKPLSRRNFVLGAISLGVIGSLFGSSYLEDSSNREELLTLLKNAKSSRNLDPRLQIASDWFDQSFADGTWDAMYDRYVKNWLENTTHNLGKDFDSLSDDEQLSYIIDYITDYSPEEWGEALTSAFENMGYEDPGETGEMDVYNELDNLIRRKLKKYYTPDKIKQLRSR